jgi:hypothetical protein
LGAIVSTESAIWVNENLHQSSSDKVGLELLDIAHNISDAVSKTLIWEGQQSHLNYNKFSSKPII